jgi:hypothetical protein
MPGTALVPASIPSPDPDARADRFLARVAALTPAEWGRLDAIGAEHVAQDAWGAVSRVRQTAALLDGLPAGPVLGAVFGGMTALFLAVDLARVGVAGLLGVPRPAGWMRRPADRPEAPAGAPLSPEAAASRRVTARLQRLHDLAGAQPGGVGPSVAVLGMALVAAGAPDEAGLRAPDGRPKAVLAALYAPVEPVIPFASLG